MFSTCVCGGIFATLIAVDASIVFSSYAVDFQVEWLEPQMPLKFFTEAKLRKLKAMENL